MKQGMKQGIPQAQLLATPISPLWVHLGYYTSCSCSHLISLRLFELNLVSASFPVSSVLVRSATNTKGLVFNSDIPTYGLLPTITILFLPLPWKPLTSNKSPTSPSVRVLKLKKEVGSGKSGFRVSPEQPCYFFLS